MLEFKAEDGRPRASLYLFPEGKPILLLDDETGPRVSLGLQQSDTPGPEDNDWALTFEPDRAWIGMYTHKTRGHNHVQGAYGVHTDRVESPHIQPK
jgi:hypothetical protein